MKCYSYFDYCFQSSENVKMILSSWAMTKETVGQNDSWALICWLPMLDNTVFPRLFFISWWLHIISFFKLLASFFNKIPLVFLDSNPLYIFVVIIVFIPYLYLYSYFSFSLFLFLNLCPSLLRFFLNLCFSENFPQSSLVPFYIISNGFQLGRNAISYMLFSCLGSA